MTQVLKSLEKLATGYSIFEKDQVLTHDQLNSIADYLDDQTRLSRIQLLGIGIAYGLRVTKQGNTINLSKGVGVTTDGDLLYFNKDTVFDKFKIYDLSYPAYAPFYKNGDVKGQMNTVYELVRQSDTNPQSTSLSQFNTPTRDLSNMVAVLLMESYVKDDDLCSGTDCDNLGKDCINTPKLLLVATEDIGLLKEKAMATPQQAFSQLNEVVADRALIPSSTDSFDQLAQSYGTVCNKIHNKLFVELPKVYASCSTFLNDIFSAAPTWNDKLNAIKANISGANNSGIQYYYDFLKDVVETYNHFRDLLFGDTTGCCPDTESFPKHLLLGNLIPGTDLNENRTGFYPSSIVSRTAEQLNHAKFLAKKLDVLIQSFQIPTSGNLPVRITPSQLEEQPLEERAIPYYYAISRANPVHQHWNFRLHQRRMDAYNYSYHANLQSGYQAWGGAAAPFSSQIGRFSFFRIEGHLGKNVGSVKQELEQAIAANNLPFTVQAVLLGNTRENVERKPGIRYSALHDLHDLLRRDALLQLNEVENFSRTFTEKVNQSVSADENGAADKKKIAQENNQQIERKVPEVRKSMELSYSQYHFSKAVWRNDLTDVLNAAGQFKQGVGDVVRTDVNTPFDSIISNTHLQWISWLDDIIQVKEKKEDEKLLFSKFIKQHPSLEHFGGVMRGGTFVLVHNDKKNVIADFMLPYYCYEITEEETDEPQIKQPAVRPNQSIINNGIRVLPSQEKLFKDFRLAFVPEIEQKINFQEKYFNIYKDFVDSTSKIVSSIDPRKANVGGIREFSDALLDAQVNEARSRRQKLDLLRQKAGQQDLPENARQAIAQQIRVAEGDLGRSIQEMSNYISTFDIDVSMGSDGYRALNEMSNNLGAIRNQEVKTNVRQGLTTVSNATRNENLKLIVGNMSNMLGR
jgi:hypothetical protein